MYKTVINNENEARNIFVVNKHGRDFKTPKIQSRETD